MAERYSMARHGVWILLAVALPIASGASAPDAHDAQAVAVARACVAASGLNAAQPQGEQVEFDDFSGQTALLVQGVYPQRRMRGARGLVLCLYDRRTGRASAAQWPADPAAGPAHRDRPR